MWQFQDAGLTGGGVRLRLVLGQLLVRFHQVDWSEVEALDASQWSLLTQRIIRSTTHKHSGNRHHSDYISRAQGFFAPFCKCKSLVIQVTALFPSFGSLIPSNREGTDYARASGNYRQT